MAHQHMIRATAQSYADNKCNAASSAAANSCRADKIQDAKQKGACLDVSHDVALRLVRVPTLPAPLGPLRLLAGARDVRHESRQLVHSSCLSPADCLIRS